MATLNLHLGGGIQQVAGIDPGSAAGIVAGYIRAVDSGRAEMITLVGRGNGVTSRHLSTDIIRLEITP